MLSARLFKLLEQLSAPPDGPGPDPHGGLRHVTPHGLRSYFVTQARESGLSDAEIAMLIGDRTGPAIIAQTYGDVRSEHLFKQAQRIRFKIASMPAESGQ